MKYIISNVNNNNVSNNENGLTSIGPRTTWAHFTWAHTFWPIYHIALADYTWHLLARDPNIISYLVQISIEPVSF